MDWTNLVVGAIIGFFVSIIANIYTDKYKDWTARRTIQTKSRRISQLKADMERFSEYKKTPVKFYLLLIRRLFVAIFGIQVLIFITFAVLATPVVKEVDVFTKEIIPLWPVMSTSITVYTRLIMLAMIISVVAISYYTFNSTMKDLNIFINFEEFKKAVNKRIEGLS